MSLSRKPPATQGQAVAEFALLLPIMLLLVLGIGDFARFYTDTIALESGAREAADYGAFYSSNWTATSTPITVYGPGGMEQRACTAAANLPGYAEPPGTLNHGACTNPSFTYELVMPPGVTDCSQASNNPPCTVHVTLSFTFTTFIDGLCLQGTPLCLPGSLTLQRDSRYAVSDFPSS